MNQEKLNELVKTFRAKDPNAVVTFNPEGSAVSILRGRLAEPLKINDLRKSPFDHARSFLHKNRDLFGRIDTEKELENARVTVDRQGMTHAIFNQKYGQAQVLGGTLSVHYDEEGRLYLIKSDLASSIDLPKAPKISAEKALEIAQKYAGDGAMSLAPGLRGAEPTLVVADAKILNQERGNQKYHLCWKLRIVSPNSKRNPDCIYFVDAMSGKVLLIYPAIQTGTGIGFYSQGSALNSEASGGTYRLRDAATTSSWPVATKPLIHTYDDACSTSYGLANNSEDNNDNWDNGGTLPANRCDDQRAEVDIQRYLGYVLSYYHLTHGLNSLNNNGMDVKGHAHYSLNYNNAFWEGGTQQIYFGDGDGNNRNFYTPLDVVGHEFTHGVNDVCFNIVQTYSGETGVLSEALSDLFGCLIALDYPAEVPNPWNHGQLYHITGRGRNMADPSRDSAGVVHYDATSDATKYNSASAGYYPDHYSIRYNPPLPWNKYNDYGGVHIDCTIITHAVYLMINGGTHRLSGVTVAGIGQSVVEELLYHVISIGLLNNTSVFADFRIAFILACQAL